MIKLYYPEFWQKRGLLAYLLLPIGWIFLLLGFIRKLFSEQICFNSFTICVGNCTIGGTGKTQLIISLAKEFSKRNMNFIILSKGYGGKCTIPTLVSASSSPDEVGDEALELCQYGNCFVMPNIKDAGPIISKYKPDLILVDDGMQNPHFKKDIIIMTIDGQRGFGNGFPIPAGPMRSFETAAINVANLIVINGELQKTIDSIETKPYFYAKIEPCQSLLKHKYFAFAGIGNPEQFFSILKSHGSEIIDTKIFPDHHKYSLKDIQGIISISEKQNLKPITTRKDYVKIKNLGNNKKPSMKLALEYAGLSEKKEIEVIPEISFLEVELKIEDKKKFLDIILSKYEKFMQHKV